MMTSYLVLMNFWPKESKHSKTSFFYIPWQYLGQLMKFLIGPSIVMKRIMEKIIMIIVIIGGGGGGGGKWNHSLVIVYFCLFCLFFFSWVKTFCNHIQRFYCPVPLRWKVFAQISKKFSFRSVFSVVCFVNFI